MNLALKIGLVVLGLRPLGSLALATVLGPFGWCANDRQIMAQSRRS